MPSRHYFWTLVLLILSCSTFFHRRSEFEKGLADYQAEYFLKAAKHFETYYAEHIESQTTLYYLYDCYKKLNQGTEVIHVLEQLVKTATHTKARPVVNPPGFIEAIKNTCKAPALKSEQPSKK